MLISNSKFIVKKMLFINEKGVISNNFEDIFKDKQMLRCKVSRWLGFGSRYVEERYIKAEWAR